MSDPWQTDETMPARRGFGPGAVAAFATVLVLLAIVGLAIGWVAADADRESDPVAVTSPSVPAVASVSPDPSPSVSPSAEPSAAPTPSPASSSASDGEPLPDATGVDFREARQALRDRRLGVTVVFDGDADGDSTVTSTRPEPGTPVTNGDTIILYVSGEPPLVTDLDLVALKGLTCKQAGSSLAASGLLILKYEGAQADPFLGIMIGKDSETLIGFDVILPALRWNDRVRPVCGAGPAAY